MDQCVNLCSLCELFHKKKQVTTSEENHILQGWLMFSEIVREEEECRVVVAL